MTTPEATNNLLCQKSIDLRAAFDVISEKAPEYWMIASVPCGLPDPHSTQAIIMRACSTPMEGTCMFMRGSRIDCTMNGMACIAHDYIPALALAIC